MSGVYNTAKKELADGTINIANLKCMFVDSGYTFNADHDFVDNGADDATDPSFNEITATNYTGGHAGAGRKALASAAWAVDKANDRAELDATDPSTWTALGGATNDTIDAIIVFEERASDVLSRLVCYIDSVSGVTWPYTTNGSDLTISINSEGILTLT